MNEAGKVTLRIVQDAQGKVGTLQLFEHEGELFIRLTDINKLIDSAYFTKRLTNEQLRDLTK